MKLIFMGTPAFALPTFEALLAAGQEIVAVYSQPARLAGRGQQLRASPIAQRAEAEGLPLVTPLHFRTEAEIERVKAFGAEAAIVVAYGLILPPPLLAAFPRGCINVHASLLPRWRGAAPIARAIEAGDRETGITIMQMDAGLDSGAMLAQASVPIREGQTTAGLLHDELALLGARLLVETLDRLADIRPVAQQEALVTTAPKILKSEARIDWQSAARPLARKINALAPFPGAWFTWAGERVKVLQARVLDARSEVAAEPGQVIAREPLLVACKAGRIELLRLQRAGKKPGPSAEVLRGWPALDRGARLE